MKFGIYHYPWYCQQKWAEAPRRQTPSIGQYHSTDPGVIKWQMELIADCGFDYVVFELVPLSDWSFPTVQQTVQTALQELKTLGLSWNFLLDVIGVFPAKKEYLLIKQLIEHVQSMGWEEGLVTGPAGKPLLMAFSPGPYNARKIRDEYADTYDFRFPTFMPHWGMLDSETDSWTDWRWRPRLREAKAKGLTWFDALLPDGYIAFWENSISPACFDGFCAVMPGYDDRLLNRGLSSGPTVDARDGQTFQSQFQNALAAKPQHVLAYGWNEYFENTVLEPTKEHGDFYVDLCRRLIAEAHAEA